MVLPLWRSLHSLNLMLPKEDRKAMLLRMYNDNSPLMDHSKERFRKISTTNGDAPIPDDELITTASQADKEVDDEADIIDGGIGDDDEMDVEQEGVSIGADRERERDAEAEVQAEVDVALGAKDEEDIGMEGGVELG